MRKRFGFFVLIIFIGGCIQLTTPPVDTYIATLLSLVKVKNTSASNTNPPPTLSYTGSPFTFTQNQLITTVTPAVTGTITTCAASPTLPVGLVLSTTTCAISGTPSAIQTAADYTITASNSAGTAAATISITVNTIITYTITFNMQGGTGGTSSAVATPGSAMPAATAPTKGGFIFQGYFNAASGGTKYYNADMTGALNWDVAANATLYAQWDWMTYSLRATGPAGGLIFYINPNYATDGWKYLESWTADAGTFAYKTSNTSTPGAVATIGSGYTITYSLMPGAGYPAAVACRNATYGGYTGWFLPSLDELSQMYANLKAFGVGGLASAGYWSSTTAGVGNAYYINFATGIPATSSKMNNLGRVRAARRF